jgi:bifunctional DNA-binding transcriptional regulator/antitoxin component of YhaV-PrlF toxin-antitoxin module
MTNSAIEVQIGANGRLMIPDLLQQELGLKSGDRLVARVEAGRLIFEKAETIKQRLKQHFAHLQDTGLVEELINERRLAAQEEDA